jgi:GNAT superfamily N-acetyltransferase
MNPAIREARVSDAPAISRLIVGLVDYFLSDPDAPELGPFLETLTPAATAERIQSRNFDYLVAEYGSGILGVIAIRDDSHVYHLFVQSDAHRRGIARALWEHARARSAATAFTVNSSIFAVPAYERLGFTAVDVPQTKDGLVFVPMEYRRTI